jgi:hypothetical protein
MHMAAHIIGAEATEIWVKVLLVIAKTIKGGAGLCQTNAPMNCTGDRFEPCEFTLPTTL